MAGTHTQDAPRVDTRTRRSPRFRVLLHDDDRHTMAFVVVCLMNVFGLGFPDARAIMSEAHSTGTALCRIAPLEEATRDRDRLRAHGLSSTVEPD